MDKINLVFAGFGGQGILFAAKIIAYAGMLSGKKISWLPSYGPEMRGGTANCSVCISDTEIGSPLITSPNVLLVMNLPSLDKFLPEVEAGGTIIVDSSLANKKIEREDVNVHYIPATKLAEDNDIKGFANIIMLGKLLKELKFCSEEILDKAMAKCIPSSKAHLVEVNQKAVKIGLEN